MSLIPIFKDTFFIYLGNNKFGIKTFLINKNVENPKRGEILKKFIKKIFICLILSLLSFIGFNINLVNASELEVIPGGETVGIKLNTGVYVAGKYQVETINGKKTPWRKSDIEIGDKILKVDGSSVSNNQQLSQNINASTDEEVILTILRGSMEFDTNIEIEINKQNEKSIGLYIKDKIVGVGTLTFINPDTKSFASLGHGIVDQKALIGSISGDLVVSNIDDIKKASPGVPGEKKAIIGNDIIGKLSKNNATGLYGKINSRTLLNKKKIKVATQDEVKLGKATILTVLEGDEVKEYSIEIIEINKQNTRNIKGLKIKVTDPVIIEKCGGIIQGMSGSPIIQNGKLVGAVSHVIVDDPLTGYGMHIEWMLNDANL